MKVVGYDNAEHPKTLQTVSWTIEQAQKEGYDHFMLKEINEQPQALRQTITPRVKNSLPDFECDQIDERFFTRFKSVKIVACGTAMHAGLIGREVIEKLSRINVGVEIASEFRYRNPILESDDLVIIISQSGETADSLAALRLAKSKGVTTLAIVNVAGSSIAREADHVIFTYAGPEISVASTKAYSVQIAILYLIAVQMALVNGAIGIRTARYLTNKLSSMPDVVKKAISDHQAIKNAVKAFNDAQHLFFLGRGLDYALACEGFPEIEGNFLHPLRSLCRRGIKNTAQSPSSPTAFPSIALSSHGFALPKNAVHISGRLKRGSGCDGNR